MRKIILADRLKRTEARQRLADKCKSIMEDILKFQDMEKENESAVRDNENAEMQSAIVELTPLQKAKKILHSRKFRE